MKPLDQCRLYTFVDTAYLRGRAPDEIAQALCDGGSDLLQLRAKDWTPHQIRRTAELLLPITERAGVGLVINDHPQIALRIGAPLCHLGQEDFFDRGYRTAAQVTGCPKEMRLGLSTHAPEQALRALRAEPDYIAIGPVYPTATKPGRPAVTLDYVRWAAAHVRIPWFAIGGITLENLDDVLAAGAPRICVVGAILNAPDLAKACREFGDRLASRRVTRDSYPANPIP
jgi:thiamine-phosphate pyrophosphorylase